MLVVRRAQHLFQGWPQGADALRVVVDRRNAVNRPLHHYFSNAYGAHGRKQILPLLPAPARVRIPQLKKRAGKRRAGGAPPGAGGRRSQKRPSSTKKCTMLFMTEPAKK